MTHEIHMPRISPNFSWQDSFNDAFGAQSVWIEEMTFQATHKQTQTHKPATWRFEIRDSSHKNDIFTSTKWFWECITWLKNSSEIFWIFTQFCLNWWLNSEVFAFIFFWTLWSAWIFKIEETDSVTESWVLVNSSYNAKSCSSQPKWMLFTEFFRTSSKALIPKYTLLVHANTFKNRWTKSPPHMLVQRQTLNF